jgi:hypothetical protein
MIPYAEDNPPRVGETVMLSDDCWVAPGEAALVKRWINFCGSHLWVTNDTIAKKWPNSQEACVETVKCLRLPSNHNSLMSLVEAMRKKAAPSGPKTISCPMCGSANTGWVMCAEKCEDCWHTW